ncbi:MAG: PspC domain-containing protein [Ardenticatenaceae bacterium]|nr:PspC domain-containing protein [Anaerolineales bacterium]MCB8977933.1 PspC domain-containing protein [Ardenticatenaceae bacterium]
MSESRLTRSETDKMIAGVCGGLAEYLNLDPVWVRLLFVLLIFASGIGIPIYLVLWVIMPRVETAGQPGSTVLQDNFEDLSQTFSEKMNRLSRPGTIGTLLILFGVYFLLTQLGWFHWLNGAIFWPIVIIGAGVYMLARREA